MSENKLIEMVCKCGEEFKMWTSNLYYDSFPPMCKECRKKEDWYYHSRLIGINDKIKCIRCGWNLTYKDSIDTTESQITFRCKCCGLNFTIYHGEPDCGYPYEEDERSDQERIDEANINRYGEC